LDKLCYKYCENLSDVIHISEEIGRENILTVLPVKSGLFKCGYGILYWREIENPYNKKIICKITGEDCIDQTPPGKYDSCLRCEVYKERYSK